MASNESTKKVLLVAVVLCLVCSVVVSSAAVLLRNAQDANKARDMKSNILAAAGMLEPGVPVEKQFEKVQPRLVNLDTGKFSDKFKPAAYNERKAAKSPELSEKLSDEEDIAKIQRRENYAKVYLVYNGSQLEKVILPIRGYGLWSTMYGFLALKSDLNTVAGIGFYEQGETPGLGGKVDSPLWKAKWPGKEVYKPGQWQQPALDVIKGEVDNSRPIAKYRVDGLSGATLTTRGVDNLIHFWLGEHGFAKFLSNLRKGEA